MTGAEVIDWWGSRVKIVAHYPEVPRWNVIGLLYIGTKPPVIEIYDAKGIVFDPHLILEEEPRLFMASGDKE